MPQRDAVSLLPEQVREELERRLLSNGFSNYVALSDWLKEQGFEISKSAIGRYGQKFEERVRALQIATQQARALAEAAPDDEGALNDSLIRLVQERLFTILVDLNVEQIDNINIGSLTKGIATLARATVKQKEWQVAVREKAAAAADAVEHIARKGGLSDEAAAEIRAKILGVAK